MDYIITQEYTMELLRESIMNSLSKLPVTAKVDDYMYRLYVIDKINKGKEAVLVDNYITSEKLREKVKRW